jgi:hypothetical protein
MVSSAAEQVDARPSVVSSVIEEGTMNTRKLALANVFSDSLRTRAPSPVEPVTGAGCVKEFFGLTTAFLNVAEMTWA